MLPHFLLHAGDPTSTEGLIRLFLIFVVAGVILFLADRLFAGPLGKGNARKLGTVAVLLVLGAALIAGVERLIPH